MKWLSRHSVVHFLMIKLFTWKVNVLIILKMYKREIISLVNLQFIALARPSCRLS